MQSSENVENQGWNSPTSKQQDSPGSTIPFVFSSIPLSMESSKVGSTQGFFTCGSCGKFVEFFQTKVKKSAKIRRRLLIMWALWQIILVEILGWCIVQRDPINMCVFVPDMRIAITYERGMSPSRMRQVSYCWSFFSSIITIVNLKGPNKQLNDKKCVQLSVNLSLQPWHQRNFAPTPTQ